MGKNILKRIDLIFKDEADYKAVLKKAASQTNDELINELIASGLKGRGGAGFPTGLKWKLTSESKADKKYVICNADEGEPGTFKDREILTQVPHKVLTGMAICGKIIGAKEGFIYLRKEYNYLTTDLNKIIDEFHEVCKKLGLDFKIKIFLGYGAYICGEESALFESMEGKRGEPRNKPPYPSEQGYLGRPTVINNVETLAHTFTIFQYGASKFNELGVQDSYGSKLFSISGDTPIPGIYELELGMTVEDFANDFGDGDTKAVQVGGASGFCVPRKKFRETHIGYQGKLTGISLPTGGSMMLFNSSRSMFNLLTNYLEFFTEESCGQCTPCRVGTQQLLEGSRAVKRGEKPAAYLDKLLALSETMKSTSKCGLGQSVANSFQSIVENFREEMIY
ncbi:MAG: NADH-ubiquinone oxidoreductase-F iron-sulfur binding region domain-containing protein [Tenuifilaceae bacterium]|jgi:[NiFe] hydrogenase diaphorase moiety large subunit|uniref:NADH-ubiquinone oxidoreductase-F iron-sulfur binding region domain-containing protein n=1 Tax=Perlabentimonas gracilis TaxID=2715279 RepID=UPI00140DF271|nr:NADH-ubiquinone oxidoreductase-F iron-sulfur binding region domain-containing protein [Perlabentimonas gracilis]MDX9769558.1 NADH-ubiquinone oxidoreductase-F iron-sulfur binding region domain-containing protein [Tenuifilaceae bacterium]NHB69767.1 NADH-quinone oxidoreductase subunit E [Perlabentimonas gracilis]